MIGQIRNKIGDQLRVVCYTIMLTVALVALSAPAGGVFAEDPDQDAPSKETGEFTPGEVQDLINSLDAADNALSAFVLLTAAEQEAVTAAMTSGEVGSYTMQQEDSDDEECRTQSRVSWRKDAFGNYVWKYRSKTHFCYDGTQITSDPFFTLSGHVFAVLWEFVGTLDESESGGEGDWMHQDYGQGHFRLCIGPGSIGCIQNDYPAITKRQYGDGTYEWE